MSPFYWDSGVASVFSVHASGYLDWEYVYTDYGIRPVINLKSDVTFNSGSDGTKDSPYIVQ